MRIKSWHMAVRGHKELIPRNVIGMQQEPGFFEQLSKNITRQGITNSTLNYLRVSGDIVKRVALPQETVPLPRIISFFWFINENFFVLPSCV